MAGLSRQISFSLLDLHLQNTGQQENIADISIAGEGRFAGLSLP